MKRIIYIIQNGEDQSFFGRLNRELNNAYPGEFKIKTYETRDIDKSEYIYEKLIGDLDESDFFLISVHSGLTHFKSFNEIFNRYKGNKKMFIFSGISEELMSIMSDLGINIVQYGDIETYIRAGGIENYFQKVLYLANEFMDGNYLVKRPEYRNRQGLYTPHGKVEDLEQYILEGIRSKKPMVGAIIHENHLMRDDLEILSSIYNNIEKQGGYPVILVTHITANGKGGALNIRDALVKYFMRNNKPVVGSIINATGLSVSILANPGDGTNFLDNSIFELTKLPVIQAMQTYFSYEEWENSDTGLDDIMLSYCVYNPELDGQITTYPFYTSELVETKDGMERKSIPIENRTQKITQLAINWANLKKMENKNKKVAIIFHNMPPRNDMIGSAFGLDSPNSVLNIIEAMKSEGVYLDYDFEDGEEIIKKITRGLSNDTGWLPDEKVLERAIDTVKLEKYIEWFNKLSIDVREKMIDTWGNPPGDILTVNDDILIPGILNGNVFIGLQPPRNYDGRVDEMYHDTQIVTPHQYIAFYKWIEEVFQADVIVHVGTHGTLEWLPGKEIALTDKCYPDITIGNLPNLYFYNISISGEGMQAKRRSYAALVGHMIPSMKKSGLYDELETIDILIDEYFHSIKNHLNREDISFNEIWSLSKDLELLNDIGIEEWPKDEFEKRSIVLKLHTWIEQIKNSEVRDGLHILGEMDFGERFTNICRLLVKVRNNDVPSLREAVSDMMGYDMSMIENLGEVIKVGQTKSMLLNEIDDKGDEILEILADNNFEKDALKNIDGVKSSKKLKACLEFITDTIVPKLKQTNLEIENFIKGINGEFISPGPSGNPSRGNVDILPTGRNFYSVDPGMIPTRTAWEVGKQLANDMLDREFEISGKYPNSVAMVIYGGETMQTYGEDIAEALYLIGVRPIWLKDTDRVIGVEIIPMEELKRPRIDVTLRISGLFRDTFPNMIEKFEDGINKVLELDESYDENYVKKNIEQEILEKVDYGFSRMEANKRSRARIFGCPPKTYGTGVSSLIYSRKWTEQEDLATVYIDWSGHAYGKELQGIKYQDELKNRLSKTTVTIKNEPSIEIDMLDSSDFYNYHGGLISAVKMCSLKEPHSYTGNTSDIDNISVLSLKQETSRIVRSRINNPKWIEGLKRHGYKGGSEVSAMVDIVFGWDATCNNIENWMYDEITRRFVVDIKNSRWIKAVNPWAMNSMVERLLEAYKRKMWSPAKGLLGKLEVEYIESEGLIEELS